MCGEKKVCKKTAKKKAKCLKPENLQGKPGACSPEQIRKCHGKDKGHPCTGSGEEPEKEA